MIKSRVVSTILLIGILCVLYGYINKNEVEEITRINILKRVDVSLSNKDQYHCFKIDENIVQCSLECFSSIVEAMLHDKYKLVSEETCEDYIDVILQKDNTKIRLHYLADYTLTSIAKPYEKSTEFMTYINEECIHDYTN